MSRLRRALAAIGIYMDEPALDLDAMRFQVKPLTAQQIGALQDNMGSVLQRLAALEKVARDHSEWLAHYDEVAIRHGGALERLEQSVNHLSLHGRWQDEDLGQLLAQTDVIGSIVETLERLENGLAHLETHVVEHEAQLERIPT